MNINAFATPTARWAAVRSRDRAADGAFYYGVVTTGIYCRPSCGARRPRADNVRFFDDVPAARLAGLRPCLRCHPDAPARWDPTAAAITRACRRIAGATQMPDLAALAREAHLSRFHFHRLFKQRTGLTPRGYMHALRAQRMRTALERGQDVTDAIFEAGFGSSSRFYEGSAQALGMAPTTYRAGGAGELIRYALGRCSLGRVLVAATERGVCAILLGDDTAALLEDLRRRFSKARLLEGGQDFAQWISRAVAVVEQPAVASDLPLDLLGTAFQHRVWQALQELAPGTTASYADIARRIGQPRCARAVGRAVAANPVAVVIPCHRVIPSDGSTGGYRWGQARKLALLARERDAAEP
jgi:AraC family transcriptional regulator, regulatory protein of adaptative response / methylated-DNA-[protein]-cysteine methyltransferase